MKKSVMIVLVTALMSFAFAYESLISTNIGWGGTLDVAEIDGNNAISLNHGADVNLVYRGFFTPAVGFFVQGNLLMYFFGSDIDDFIRPPLVNDFSNRFSINVGPSFRIGKSIIDVGIHYGLRRMAGKYEAHKKFLMWNELGVSFGGRTCYPVSKNVSLLFGSNLTVSFLAFGNAVAKNINWQTSKTAPVKLLYTKYASVGCVVNMGIVVTL